MSGMRWDLQGGQHVAGANAVDADSCMRPFHGKTRSQMPHSGLCGIVRGLRLGYVNNGAGHRSNHDH